MSRLVIDGALFVDNVAVNVTPVVSSTGLSELYELSITGIGLATEDGDGTTVHEITVYLDTDPSQANSIWVWDTTEVPSGIVFNPATLATAQIQATPPE